MAEATRASFGAQVGGVMAQNENEEGESPRSSPGLAQELNHADPS